jgi:hypothetical protein
MVSLNSRAGLRRALEPGHGPLSEAYSFPQFSFSHVPDTATHKMTLTSLEATLEKALAGQDSKSQGQVRVDNGC